MLPTVVFGILSLATLAAAVPWSEARARWAKLVAAAGVASYLALHVSAAAAWSASISRGPAEERFVAAVRAGIEDGRIDPDAEILVAQDYLVGAAHTEDAYAAYLATMKPGQSINLYDAILASGIPATPRPINFRYVTPPGYGDGEATAEDKIAARRFFAAPPSTLRDETAKTAAAFWRFRPRIEVNQFDFFDESLARLFFRDSLLDSYVPLPLSGNRR